MGWSVRCSARSQIGFANRFSLFEIPPSRFKPNLKTVFLFCFYECLSLFSISFFGFNPFSKNLEWVGPRDVVRAVKLALQIGFPCLRKSILESLPRD